VCDVPLIDERAAAISRVAATTKLVDALRAE